MDSQKAKRKAEKFVNLLAQNLSKEGANVNTVKENLAKFNEAVSLLPSGKLKREIATNQKTYSSLFVSAVKSLSPGKPITTNVLEGSERLFNLYVKKGHKISPAISSLPSCEQEDVYNVFLGKQFGQYAVDTTLQALTEKEGTVTKHTWLNELHRLCRVTCDNANPDTLQQLMIRYQQQFAASVDECIADKKHKGAKKLTRELLHFLIVCHFRMKDVPQAFSNPSYPDVVASLLSSYIDVSLLVLRDAEDSTSAGRKMSLAIVYLLHSYPSYLLDVIIQTTTITATDAPIMESFLSQAMTPPSDMSSRIFAKYIAAVRHLMSCLDEKTREPIKRAAVEIPAPDDFLTWLSDKDSSLLDNLPITRHFQGLAVTKHLLDEADDEFISQMLDLLTETIPDNPETPSAAATDVTKSAIQAEETDSLFFIDTSNSTAVADQFQDKIGTEDNTIHVPDDIGVQSDQEEEMSDDLDSDKDAEEEEEQPILEVPAIVGEQTGKVAIVGQIPQSCMEQSTEGTFVLKPNVSVVSAGEDGVGIESVSESVSERVPDSNSDVETENVVIPDLALHMKGDKPKAKKFLKTPVKKTTAMLSSPVVAVSSVKSTKQKSCYDFTSESEGPSPSKMGRFTKFRSSAKKNDLEAGDSVKNGKPSKSDHPNTRASRNISGSSQGSDVPSADKSVDVQDTPRKGRYSLRRFSECSHTSVDEIATSEKPPSNIHGVDTKTINDDFVKLKPITAARKTLDSNKIDSSDIVRREVSTPTKTPKVKKTPKSASVKKRYNLRK